jgi:hypothetical protein
LTVAVNACVHLGAFFEDVGEQGLGGFKRRLALGEPLLAGRSVDAYDIVRFQ